MFEVIGIELRASILYTVLLIPIGSLRTVLLVFPSPLIHVIFQDFKRILGGLGSAGSM
jgi:hypothetical protein